MIVLTEPLVFWLIVVYASKMATMVVPMMWQMCFLLFCDARGPKYWGPNELGEKIGSTYVHPGFAYVQN
jgi:hypothetical protein